MAARDRIERLGQWLGLICNRSSLCTHPMLSDMMLSTMMWNVGPLIAIDPWLGADNDNEAQRSE